MKRYTEKIKVLPDEVRNTMSKFKRFVPTPWCTRWLFDALTECPSVGSFRIAPSAWRGCSCPRAMKASCSTKASSPSWWASLASAGTCTICCAWWPCTAMATRWVKAGEPHAVVMSLLFIYLFIFLNSAHIVVLAVAEEANKTTTTFSVTQPKLSDQWYQNRANLEKWKIDLLQ